MLIHSIHRKRVWVQYPVKAVGNFQRGNQKEITDNWYPLQMARGTITVYPGKRNKGLSSTFQPPEEGRSVQRPKRCDKHCDKDEDNSPKNVSCLCLSELNSYNLLINFSHNLMSFSKQIFSDLQSHWD